MEVYRGGVYRGGGIQEARNEGIHEQEVEVCYDSSITQLLLSSMHFLFPRLQSDELGRTLSTSK